MLLRKGMDEFGHLELSQPIGKTVFLDPKPGVDTEPGWVGCGVGESWKRGKPPLVLSQENVLQV